MKYPMILRLIQNLEQTYKGPIQGSEEWLAMRIPSKDQKRGKIGGSEIATLLNLNPYGKRRDLILNKLGKKKVIVDNIFVHLGSLLEEVSVMVFEKTFNTEVYCKNISIIEPCGIKNMIFSPDGVCALPLTKTKIKLNPIKGDCNCCPVLIEIKNPWSRIITRDGQVPEQYMPQIQAGLMAIPSLHAGIFIDTQTRLCEYTKLDTTGYNKKLYKGKGLLQEEVEPIHRGIIIFYGKMPRFFKAGECKTIKFGSRNIYDFGSCDDYNTTTILREAKGRTIQTEYHPIYNTIKDVKNDSNKIADIITTKNAIGIVSYKVYDITYTICYKDTEMINNIKTELGEYTKGSYDIDGDYVEQERKRKRSRSAPRAMPNLNFDVSSGEERRDGFTFSESD